MTDLRTSLRLALVGFLACVLTTSVLYSVLDSNEWFVRCVAAVAIVAGVGAGARLARVPRPLIPLLQAAGVLLFVTASYARTEAYSGWLPGTDAQIALRELGESAFTELDELTPPITPSPGVTFVIVVGVAAMAILVDLLAASYRQTAVAGLPLLVLYCVPAAVLPDGLPGELFVLPALGYLLLLITDSRERLLRWGVAVSGRAGGEPRRSAGELGQMSRRIGFSVLAMALVIPALAPRLSEDAFGAGGIGNDPGGGGTISTLNPLVSMRRDLVRPADIDLMRVRTDSPQAGELYLRGVTLDTFDGEEWRAGRREVRKFDPELPEAPGLLPDVANTPTTTSVEVLDAVQSDYVPMPYPPTNLEIEGSWRLDPLTLNVVSQNGPDQLAGKTYTVLSSDLDPKPEDVANALTIGEYLRPYLQLPDTLPGRVGELADRVTRNAETPLEIGISLQQWFRDPDNFAYDLRQRPGTGQDAILAFLADRRGYCEQFASTMAVMARHLGIPARINVGFTPGALADDGLSRIVSAHDAHAWPELWMPNVGWVRFEPTPGSATSNPNVPDWLAPEAEDEPRNNPDDPEGPGGEEPEPVTGGGAGGEGAGDEQTEECTGPECVGSVPPVPNDPTVGGDGPWGRLGLLAALAAALLTLPGLLRIAVRRRRWALAGSASAASMELAWRELRDSALDLGYAWPQARTPRQTAAVLADDGKLGPTATEALASLTTLVERARYAPGGAPSPGRDALRESVDTVRSELGAAAGRKRRLRALLLPTSVSTLVAGSLLRVRTRVVTARQSLTARLRPRRA